MDVAVIGASGYTGIELTRLLLGHPYFRLTRVTSRTEVGNRVADVYPKLTGATQLCFEDPDLENLARGAEVVFLALPHTAAMTVASDLLSAGVTVIDLSADYRLACPQIYEQWYETTHTSPALLERAVYGLPELYRAQLNAAQLVACPGCYPTATLLAAAPALESGIISGDTLIVDAKSGVSGAGKTPSATTHFPIANEAVAAYKVGAHRHTPEIEQQASILAQRSINTVFTPHLVPMTRGLLSTIYLAVGEHLCFDDVYGLYVDRYSEEPFIKICEPGDMPSTSHVSGTNRAHIGLALDRAGVLVVSCAVDNLMKGASGQAVQCANVVFGFDESAGLESVAPVI